MAETFARKHLPTSRTLTKCLPVCLACVIVPSCLGQQPRLLVDQVGYETGSPKQALIMGVPQDQPQQFSLVDTATGKIVFTGELRPAGTVHAWNGTYWIADFSSWKQPGHYLLRTNNGASEASSSSFDIGTIFLSATRFRTCCTTSKASARVVSSIRRIVTCRF